MKRLLKLLKLLTILIVLLLGAGGITAYWIDAELKTPHLHDSANELIAIEPGTGRKSIVNRLVQEGIIKHSFPVLIYMTLRPQTGKLQAGDYKFESPITPLGALEKMRRGLVATEQITIPEGYDRFDILQALANAEIDNSQALETAILEKSLIADIDPNARSLEGYLFPDTYIYTRKTKADQFIANMVKRFRQTLTPEREQKAKDLGLTVQQVVTIASLVETEAKIDEERPLIAAVFMNRFKRNMKLDCDPTFVYAAKLEGVWDGNVNNPDHRRRESLYNTYLSPGLPPGPIASPGVKSIDAVLNPAAVDYLYFVVNGTDGRHKFSRTEAEHQSAVAAYRNQQRQGQRN